MTNRTRAMNLGLLAAVGILLTMGSAAVFASRQKSSLERFATSMLRVFTVSAARADGSRFAYVLDPDGFIHHLEVGEYLGNAEGRVLRITESEVVFVELRKDGSGYREVEAVLKCDAWCRKR